MTQFEKFQEILQEMGLPFELTDDSEEMDRDQDGDIDWTAPSIDTTVIIEDKGDNYVTHPVAFLFRRDGSFKEVVVF